MALEYFHLGDANLAVNTGSTQLLNTGGTIVVSTSGVVISMAQRFYEVYHTGYTSSGASTTSDIIVVQGLTAVSQASVSAAPSSNTSAGTTIGSQREIPAGGALLISPLVVNTTSNATTGVSNFPTVFIIARSNDARIRVSIGPQNW